jgi:hypothetical protein
LKKAFEKNEKEWKKEIDKLDRERQELHTLIKQLDNEVNENQTKVSHGNPYAHMDDINRETIKQKDNQVTLIISNHIDRHSSRQD